MMEILPAIPAPSKASASLTDLAFGSCASYPFDLAHHLSRRVTLLPKRDPVCPRFSPKRAPACPRFRAKNAEPQPCTPSATLSVRGDAFSARTRRSNTEVTRRNNAEVRHELLAFGLQIGTPVLEWSRLQL